MRQIVCDMCGQTAPSGLVSKFGCRWSTFTLTTYDNGDEKEHEWDLCPECTNEVTTRLGDKHNN